MSVKVTLKDTLTNAIAEYIDEYANEDKYLDSFMWTEGNFGCDCNRYIFFYGGEVKEDLQCGDSRFKVIGWQRIMLEPTNVSVKLSNGEYELPLTVDTSLDTIAAFVSAAVGYKVEVVRQYTIDRPKPHPLQSASKPDPLDAAYNNINDCEDK